METKDFAGALRVLKKAITLFPAAAQTFTGALHRAEMELRRSQPQSKPTTVPSAPEIDIMGVKALRALIQNAGMSHAGCWEEPDLRARAHEAAAVLRYRK